MTVILQHALPKEMYSEAGLPGVAPCGANDWLRVDDAYAAQMAYRADLLRDRRDAVLWCDPAAHAAALEVLEQTLAVLPELGFGVSADSVSCPDGRSVPIDADRPLLTLGHLIQQDICILEKQGQEHVLTGAVLCFPANWRLADKAGKPLMAIHEPVDEYDANIGRRVQRLFDGVREGRPLWRFNRLQYSDADLHQPYRKVGGSGDYIRSERQCILRMPRTNAVVFAIHTHVVKNNA
ncbi:DUF3445 domain containing protein [Sulfitobacter noctilucicola]|uniref:DUF3445 domain-containing protein n=1 Tax=Sulfitobacter noctilucicola TaxID=1342301 RepID=A0A7W6MCE1_9RHOB|nr:DUF3445 domain-containing protein [Sulfitobacter noctilucicola]KIN64152.1 DUF3445 domain containing protein [Sulfitobacter noctilucicola]MBB4175506.1 hypothetical protein [Sulfitobacter noctilucicola]